MHTLKHLFFGCEVARNALGWKLVEYSNGYVIFPPNSKWSFITPMLPFAANFLTLLYFLSVGSEKALAALLVLPISIAVGFRFFRNAAAYINTRAAVFMPGSFHPRTSFHELHLYCHTEDRFSVEVLADNFCKPLTIWQANTESEMRKVYELLRRVMQVEAKDQ